MIFEAHLKKLEFMLLLSMLLFCVWGHATELTTAAKFGNVNRIEELLKSGVNINETAEFGDTALIIASEDGMTNSVEALLAHNPDLNIQNNNGNTALIRAVATDHMKIAAMLLEKGANQTIQNQYGETALKYSLEKHNKELFTLLLNHKSDLNAQDENGMTMLMRMVKDNDIEFLPLLLAHNPDLNIQDNDGCTALIYAALDNRVNMCKLLLDYKPNLNIQENYGQTALMIAARKNFKEIVDLLLPLTSVTMPNKSCFLAFEQENPVAIADGLLYALFTKVLAISSSNLLWCLFFDTNQFIQEYFKAGKFTVLINPDQLLVVIIPESLATLNITIPESLKQKEIIYSADLADVLSIQKQYGLKNLALINPQFVVDRIQMVGSEIIGAHEFAKLLDDFKDIIDISLTNYPSRIYLYGHGYTNSKIASIPVNFFDNFLNILALLHAEFLYINSCYAGGSNLLAMQKALDQIIIKQKKINYAIAIQATAGVVTGGIGNMNKMFNNLNGFLKDPVWALEFGPGVQKPPITISDVIASLGIMAPEALPSIRVPGKSELFRSLNLGNMEIITTSKLIEAGVERVFSLLAATKNTDKTIADDAKKKLQESLGIKILIQPHIQFIQIFPIDLTDFIFDIYNKNMSKFVSKLAGIGQHFIGGIIARSEFQKFINQGFVNIFPRQHPAEASQSWFIKSVRTSEKRGIVRRIKKLAIKLEPGPSVFVGSYAYIDEKSNYFIAQRGATELPTDRQTYETTVRQWFRETIPSQATLTEATGGVEVTAEEKARLEKEKGGSQALKLIEPRFARTPQDLFKMFMAD